ncbi:hypothetical protein [Streptomyces resistomycificus]|uniref:Membrane protein n=1 Tax=Streptomyces resistomycificus TaxID=67356 RepID=A0A0L8LJ03_9ACTN|nr:hypothetical protein [Streptomyces resistomycificus]KOG38213.1 membrane protein [Streptomyces resistomycificus]KUN98876.1 hypothetical protein AQJ84_13915 [Streptomyces resistomycificus]
MPTESSRTAPAAPGRTPGALLLCRAEPDSVAPVARLLREPMLLTRAGEEWSVLVPEGTPWLEDGEPVDRVLTGWATALAVGAPWPVLALWWDADRAGYTLATGFRRPVGYVWLANGTPAGEDEAMRTFAARIGLDPVLDVQTLYRLTEPASATDAPARLRALLAVLTRVGVTLPAGLAPGESADRLRAAAGAQPDARPVEWPGWRDAVRAELEAATHARFGPWFPWSGDPRARLLALAQMAAGLPLAAWGLRRRSGGWTTAGALLLAHGALGLAYGLAHPPD